MKRREMLLASASLLGLSAMTPVMAALLATKSGSEQSAGFESAFSAQERDMLSTIVDLLIPKTDTPGALEAKVDIFIDELVSNWYGSQEQAYFLKGFRILNHHCISSFSKGFLDCDKQHQLVALEDAQQNALGSLSDGKLGLDTERVSANPNDWALWGDRPRAGGAFFAQLKGLTVLAYYTSELGATQALIYDPVPGSHDGNFDFAKVNKHFIS
ncbi:gluconate 2-dehydrogenase subunit 3 family protein [Ningiella sp. W23]|uniref:gluconate 2-dehydrogenase subunit 3 family protein n=1 Tax=Ningiella sp. W23 TaxID=3023715 RepID=UPI00375809B7